MRKFSIVQGALMLALMLSIQVSSAQNILKQAIVANGGDFNDPNEYASVGSYNPATGQYTVFDTIFTSSVQDVLVVGHRAFVSAQDSLVSYDLNTLTRIAAVDISGVNKLFAVGNDILVSKGFGGADPFLERRAQSDLSLVQGIAGVDDEASGIDVIGDTAFVAVPGSWMATSGKLAIIDLVNNTFVRYEDLDTLGTGIGHVFAYQNEVHTINSQSWGKTYGAISHYTGAGSVSTGVHQNVFSSYSGATRVGNEIYLSIDGVCGIYNIDSVKITNTSFINQAYSALEFDTVNNHFYMTGQSFSSAAQLYRYNADGMLVDSVEVGTSAEAIALDYRDVTGIGEVATQEAVIAVYPNPANDRITVLTDIHPATGNVINIYSINGALVMNSRMQSNRTDIDITALQAGMYLVEVVQGDQVDRTKLIVH